MTLRSEKAAFRAGRHNKLYRTSIPSLSALTERLHVYIAKGFLEDPGKVQQKHLHKLIVPNSKNGNAGLLCATNRLGLKVRTRTWKHAMAKNCLWQTYNPRKERFVTMPRTDKMIRMLRGRKQRMSKIPRRLRRHNRKNQHNLKYNVQLKNLQTRHFLTLQGDGLVMVPENSNLKTNFVFAMKEEYVPPRNRANRAAKQMRTMQERKAKRRRIIRNRKVQRERKAAARPTRLT